MSNERRNAIGAPTEMLKPILPDVPWRLDGHDEWLLDEALAETFPASDSIAVTPIHALHRRLPLKPQELAGNREIAACNLGHGIAPGSKVLDTPIICNHCHTEIPATVALSFEGADYIYQFCGPECLDAWCKGRTNVPGQ